MKILMVGIPLLIGVPLQDANMVAVKIVDRDSFMRYHSELDSCNKLLEDVPKSNELLQEYSIQEMEEELVFTLNAFPIEFPVLILNEFARLKAVKVRSRDPPVIYKVCNGIKS
jgi:hypothetical protein